MRRDFRFRLLLVVAALLAALSTPTPAWAELSLLNASYDVTRELYKDINAAFTVEWKKRSGQELVVRQSHAGSSAQVRAVIEGLEADVVTLNQAMDIDTIASKSGLLSPDWSQQLPNQSVPFTSTILFVVRKGNPKQIRDWADLIKPGVAPVIPNPKTSGNGRYSYLAAWAYATKRSGENEAPAREYLKALFTAVPVLDTGGRGATVTFTERGIGDVLLTFENEAKLIASRPASEFEIVLPSLSILAENPVALVEKVAAKRKTSAVARAYLTFLYSPAAQEIGARHFFRPIDAGVLARHAAEFPKLSLVSIRSLGGWRALQAKHFADGALFDQLYRKH
ncbi:MAG TPA: sulfate ABC transporter substrate-binding protein [Polyangiaceae bacterium]|nr:sulfate ABC transporter substrate-binding protein [Polyangiaceae bacterium]